MISSVFPRYIQIATSRSEHVREQDSKCDAVAMRPGQHCLAGELWPIVRADDRRLTTLRADAIEDPREVIAADCMLGHDSHRFVRRIVHDG